MTLQNTAIDLLKQLDSVIRQMTEAHYCMPQTILSGASVGQHVRHTLEFFICLFDAAQHETVNYDKRKHDTVIESDKKIASSVIRSLIDFLEDEVDDKAIMLEANYAIEANETTAVKSSIYRELAYNIEHAIHHMALIKIGIKAITSTIELPAHFGVASSTVRYRQHAD